MAMTRNAIRSYKSAYSHLRENIVKCFHKLNAPPRPQLNVGRRVRRNCSTSSNWKEILRLRIGWPIPSQSSSNLHFSWHPSMKERQKFASSFLSQQTCLSLFFSLSNVADSLRTHSIITKKFTDLQSLTRLNKMQGYETLRLALCRLAV